MNTDPANSSRINSPSRCTQRFSNGKRCRLSVSANQEFCPRHAPIDDARREAKELADILTADNEEFTSATPINQFLSRLLVLLAQDRIPPRRGAVMAYTANLLLHSLRAIERENTPPEKIKLPPEVIWTFDSGACSRKPLPEQTPVPQTPTLSEPARPEASQLR